MTPRPRERKERTARDRCRSRPAPRRPHRGKPPPRGPDLQPRGIRATLHPAHRPARHRRDDHRRPLQRPHPPRRDLDGDDDWIWESAAIEITRRGTEETETRARIIRVCEDSGALARPAWLAACRRRTADLLNPAWQAAPYRCSCGYATFDPAAFTDHLDPARPLARAPPRRRHPDTRPALGNRGQARRMNPDDETSDWRGQPGAQNITYPAASVARYARTSWARGCPTCRRARMTRIDGPRPSAMSPANSSAALARSASGRPADVCPVPGTTSPAGFCDPG